MREQNSRTEGKSNMLPLSLKREMREHIHTINNNRSQVCRTCLYRIRPLGVVCELEPFISNLSRKMRAIAKEKISHARLFASFVR